MLGEEYFALIDWLNEWAKMHSYSGGAEDGKCVHGL